MHLAATLLEKAINYSPVQLDLPSFIFIDHIFQPQQPHEALLSLIKSFSVSSAIDCVCVLHAGLLAVNSWRWPPSWWWTLQVSGARGTLQKSEEPAGPSSVTTTCRRSCWSTTTHTPSHTRWTDMHRYTDVASGISLVCILSPCSIWLMILCETSTDWLSVTTNYYRSNDWLLKS